MCEYDNWKLSTPDEPKENECKYCGNECNGDYCDAKCYNNDLND